MNESPYLTPSEAASHVRRAVRSIYLDCALGRIPSTRIGGSLRIPREEFLQTLESSTRHVKGGTQ